MFVVNDESNKVHLYKIQTMKHKNNVALRMK